MHNSARLCIPKRKLIKQKKNLVSNGHLFSHKLAAALLKLDLLYQRPNEKKIKM
jgi:hypothetical protein